LRISRPQRRRKIDDAEIVDGDYFSDVWQRTNLGAADQRSGDASGHRLLAGATILLRLSDRGGVAGLLCAIFRFQRDRTKRTSCADVEKGGARNGGKNSAKKIFERNVAAGGTRAGNSPRSESCDFG